MTPDPGSVPRCGARGWKLGHLSKVFFNVPVMQTIYEDNWSHITIYRPYDIDLCIMRSRWAWPMFTVQSFCFISWRLFDGRTSYFGIISQWAIIFDLEINVGHIYLYFMVQWFCLISWRLFDVWMSYFGIMSQWDMTFDLIINVGHIDLYFMVQWFYFISWRMIFDFIINVGHSDLYFMVQWFCFISWRRFDWWTSYFGIMRHYNMTFDLKINVGHSNLYFTVQWFCLISWRLSNELHTLG